MIDKKVDYKKVEVVNTYYEGIIKEYRILCDRCKYEIKNGDKMFEMEIYDGEDSCGDSKTLCYHCMRKELTEWMEDPKGSFDINTYEADTKGHVGTKSTISEPVYEMLRKMKEDCPLEEE